MRLTDAAALAVFSTYAGRSHALTLAQAAGVAPAGFSTLKHIGYALAPQTGRQQVWVAGSAARIFAVLRAGPRAGPKVWEIREYYESRDDENAVTATLEFIASRAAAAGALRILLRAHEGGAIVPPARRAGFLPLRLESMYRLRGAVTPLAGVTSEIARRFGFRRRRSSDDAGLFRLYCSVTPVEVRTHAGMTADEWSDGLEAPERPGQEWVWERDGRIAAWLSTTDTDFGRYLAVAADGTFPHGLPALVECGVAGAGGNGAVALVPEYEHSVTTALELKGFEAVREYRVLARPLAEHVQEPAGVVAATP